MARRAFNLLVASDGSTSARAAVASVARFPWPRHSRARGVVAGETLPVAEWPPSVWVALQRSLQQTAHATRRMLRRRWPDADVAIINRPPVEAILGEARRRSATVIVVGSRGHGALARLVLGSVSLGVARRAPCTVLVAKGRRRQVQRFIIALDGSVNSRRAVEFVAGLTVPEGGAVTLVSVVEPVRPVSATPLPASVRDTVNGWVAALAAQQQRAARREFDRATGRLKPAGWTVDTE
ncbi:MAG: universal stress protein, partial [Candidatus Rokuibacteriota bacterium]